MDTDLLAVAASLVQRGWLPGIDGGPDDAPERFALYCGDKLATTADLHLAAHAEIVRRGWGCGITSIGISIKRNIGSDQWTDEPGTDTLALLRCLLAACEAQEKNNA